MTHGRGYRLRDDPYDLRASSVFVAVRRGLPDPSRLPLAHCGPDGVGGHGAYAPATTDSDRGM
jgi:hypothetical protein